jgi:hypothetical protein
MAREISASAENHKLEESRLQEQIGAHTGNQMLVNIWYKRENC